MRLLALFAIAAVTLASVPAAAQINGRIKVPRAGPTYGGADGALGKVGRDISAGRRSGQLSRSEARALRRERAAIRALQARYSRGGLSDAERAELATRIELLRNDTIRTRSR